MASYCKFSDDSKHCTAHYEVIVKECPYLYAIDKIVQLKQEIEKK